MGNFTYTIDPDSIVEAAELGIDLEAEVRKAIEIQAALEAEAAKESAPVAEEDEIVWYGGEEEAEVEDVAPAHAIEVTDDRLQDFLDRAAYRADKAAGVASAAAQPTRPVGRPRKDGQPAGSVKK